MITSPRRAARVGGALVSLAVTALLASGCDADPRTAVAVDGERLEVDRLDAVTTAYCGYISEVGVEAQPRAVVRAGFAQLWVYGAALREEAGEDLLAPPPQAEDLVAELEDAGAQAEVARETVRLLTLGNALSDPVVAGAAAQAVEGADVTVNPQVGQYDEGVLSLDGDGISVAQGEEARATTFASDAPVTPEQVAALPAGQRCGG
ncbi:hypothetical protein INN71_03835 [Nocardioides sp. ChNu-153]|uniref:hypothetical protein n=1 Tax=unclassified Nocardioides TaxID=2615069 RepID=UPI00240553D8|nr:MULTISPECIES: hypothetical protein [unclassified Nocardioides]MDF9717265.1 hypothetical protein [Nocardioides sp. ChNu-99]MDN7120519.1 hypothetical protein [Nocardioides sp. ChNu-153]